MKNMQIRTMAKEAGVYLWEIAEEMGMRDSEFSRKLRHELNLKETSRIITIIKQLAKEVVNEQ